MTKREQQACVRLVRDVLNGYAIGCVGDVDGGWLEQRAFELGLLVESSSDDGDDVYVLSPSLKKLRPSAATR